MNKLSLYLNPIARLGKKRNSLFFPFVFSVLVCIASEIFANEILKRPNIVGTYIILINVASLIYFSFRDGVRGGIIASVIPILYYFYIIFTRHYEGPRLISGITTTFVLASLYIFLAVVIGWLKQTIDTLIERESAARQLAEDGEERLQTILRQLPVGVLIADKSGGTLAGNKHMEELLGRKVAKELMTDENYLSQYAYRSDVPLTAKELPIVRAFVKGEIIIGEEMEYVRDDKKRLFLRVNAAPVLGRQKQIIAAVSTVYDITKEKELELRKDDFVNMASHELKTPITSMKLYIDLLLNRVKTHDDEKSMKMLSSVKIQTQKLQDLVNDLLDVSRIQTGKLTFNKEEFSINNLIEETVELLQGTTGKHQIIFFSKGNIRVYADRFRIYQIVTNLITNAIKYSPEGKKIILRVKKEENKAIVSVQDFGIGIPKEQQKKIFERLYQVTEPTEKTFPGLGMGLYISKEIVTRHNGKIWVEGEKGKGSIFYFSLPLKGS